MEFDKGRGKKNPDENPDTLEAMLTKLAEMEVELRGQKKEFQSKTKHLRDMIQSLKNIITAEVMERNDNEQ